MRVGRDEFLLAGFNCVSNGGNSYCNTLPWHLLRPLLACCFQVGVSTFCYNISWCRPVALNLFHISYPFIKQYFQIYLQYTQRCSFI